MQLGVSGEPLPGAAAESGSLAVAVAVGVSGTDASGRHFRTMSLASTVNTPPLKDSTRTCGPSIATMVPSNGGLSTATWSKTWSGGSVGVSGVVSPNAGGVCRSNSISMNPRVRAISISARCFCPRK